MRTPSNSLAEENFRRNTHRQPAVYPRPDPLRVGPQNRTHSQYAPLYLGVSAQTSLPSPLPQGQGVAHASQRNGTVRRRPFLNSNAVQANPPRGNFPNFVFYPSNGPLSADQAHTASGIGVLSTVPPPGGFAPYSNYNATGTSKPLRFNDPSKPSSLSTMSPLPSGNISSFTPGRAPGSHTAPATPFLSSNISPHVPTGAPRRNTAPVKPRRVTRQVPKHHTTHNVSPRDSSVTSEATPRRGIFRTAHAVQRDVPKLASATNTPEQSRAVPQHSDPRERVLSAAVARGFFKRSEVRTVCI